MAGRTLGAHSIWSGLGSLASNVQQHARSRNLRMWALRAPGDSKGRFLPACTAHRSGYATDDVFTFFDEFVIRSFRTGEDDPEVTAQISAAQVYGHVGKCLNEDVRGDNTSGQASPPVLLITELEAEGGSTPKVVGYTSYAGYSNEDTGIEEVGTQNRVLGDLHNAGTTSVRHTMCVLDSAIDQERAEALSSFATNAMELQSGFAHGSVTALGENRTATA